MATFTATIERKAGFNQGTGDSLDDFLGARTDAPKADVSLPADYRPREVGHTEPCKACRGTGTFTSYSGRALGQCFKCKGKGSRTFLTSTAQRDAAKARREHKKVDDAAAVIDAFKASYPDVWAWMDGSTFQIAQDFRAKLTQYGSLTENQINAARGMIAKRDAALAERAAKAEAAPTITMDKIEAAFATARANGLKKLKVRIAGVVFFPARADSANAGALYVKRDETYLGKIAGGKFIRSRDCDDATEQSVLSIAADPKAAAVAHGKLTGSCSCCGRELTDPISVAAGIGPICASKFGWA